MIMLWWFGSTSLVFNDGIEWGVDHSGVINLRESSISEIEFKESQKCAHNGLDLHIGKGLSYASMTASAKGNVDEFIIADSSSLGQESVRKTAVENECFWNDDNSCTQEICGVEWIENSWGSHCLGLSEK